MADGRVRAADRTGSSKAPARRRTPLPDRLKLAPDFLRFDRGSQTLLVDGATLRPLLVSEGADVVVRLLFEIDRIRDTAVLLGSGAEEALLRTLCDHGILVAEDAQARPSPGPREMKPPTSSPGMSLYLLLAQDCNLGCVYCLNGDESYHRADAPRMPREVAFKAIERCLERISPGGRLEIVFFGGEPLLNWPLAKEIINHVEGELAPAYPDRKCHFHLTSNLVRLPDDLIEWLKVHEVTVLCDIDGPPELHDQTRPMRGGQPSCERIVANARKLIDAGIPVAMRATITSRNVDHMAEIATFHREIGGQGTAVVAVNAVNSDEDILDDDLLPEPEAFAHGLRTMLTTGWDMERIFPFNQLAGQIKPNARSVIACGAPYGNTPVVDANGDVYACIYLVGMSSYKTGNVFDEADFPDPEVVGRMMRLLHVENLETCRGCAYRYVCVGGCPVGTLSIAANPKASERVRTYQRDVRCKAVQAVVEEVLWRVAERAIDATSGDGKEQPGTTVC